MKHSILTLIVAALFAAPAISATITLTPLVAAENAQPSQPVIANTCASPDVPARIDGDGFFEMPSIAAGQSVSGISVIKIDLASNGGVTSQSVFASSGDSWLDDASLRSARMTHFLPEVRNCEHVAGTYLLAVEY